MRYSGDADVSRNNLTSLSELQKISQQAWQYFFWENRFRLFIIQ